MRRLLAFLPALGWAALLFWLSAQERFGDLPHAFRGQDKVIHACAYLVLAALLLLGDGGPEGRRAWRWAAVAAFYGITDELHQMFVPGRSADVLDFLADAAGAVLAVALWLHYRRRRSREPGAARAIEPSAGG